MTQEWMELDPGALRARATTDPEAARVVVAEDTLEEWMDDFAQGGDFDMAWDTAQTRANRPAAPRFHLALVALAVAAAVSLALWPALGPPVDEGSSAAAPSAVLPHGEAEWLDIPLGQVAIIEDDGLRDVHGTDADHVEVQSAGEGRFEVWGVGIGQVELVVDYGPLRPSRTVWVQVGGDGDRRLDIAAVDAPDHRLYLELGESVELVVRDRVVRTADPATVEVSLDAGRRQATLTASAPGTSWVWLAYEDGTRETWKIIVATP